MSLERAVRAKVREKERELEIFISYVVIYNFQFSIDFIRIAINCDASCKFCYCDRVVNCE